MEREQVRQVPTEELLACMFWSWVDRRRHFWEYPEVARRLAQATPILLVGMSNMLVEGSARAGRAVVKEITT